MKLIERDDQINLWFKVELVDDTRTLVVDGRQVEQKRTVAILTCKAEACGASWDVLLDNGTVPVGPRNSLLSHGQKHAPGYKAPFRRRS